jgi:hypothetical protein
MFSSGTQGYILIFGSHIRESGISWREQAAFDGRGFAPIGRSGERMPPSPQDLLQHFAVDLVRPDGEDLA